MSFSSLFKKIVQTLNGKEGDLQITSSNSSITVSTPNNTDIDLVANFPAESADVDSLNGLQGALSITSDGSINVNPSGSNIELSTSVSQPSYAKLSDVKATGTPGGGFTAGAYRTRSLNTEYDPDDFVSLDTGTGRFTLNEGTYRIRATCPASLVGGHISKLVNITDGTDVPDCLGTTARGDADETEVTHSIIVGEFTIEDTKVFEIQHICQVTRGTDGFGDQADLGSQTELYTVVELWKVD